MDGYAYLRERDAARLAELEKTVARFEAELHAARLDPQTLEARGVHISGKTLAILLLLLPVAAAGAVINYPTYRLIGFIAKRIARSESELTATVKVIGAFLLYPLTWLAIAVLVGWKLGWPAAIIALVVVPLSAYVALRFFEQLDDVIGRARALVRRRARGALIRLRETIRDQIRAVAAEMER